MAFCVMGDCLSPKPEANFAAYGVVVLHIHVVTYCGFTYSNLLMCNRMQLTICSVPNGACTYMHVQYIYTVADHPERHLNS